MKLEEFITKYTDLSDEEKSDLQKVVQGHEDAIRTEYSTQIKELEKFKPKEKTDVEKQLETAQKELAEYKFQETVKGKGLSADLAKFLRSDADLDAFSKLIQESSSKSDNNFVPNSVNTTGTGISKEDFHKMSYGEKAKLYTESPELYSQLSET
jgi:hypothetical protein